MLFSCTAQKKNRKPSDGLARTFGFRLFFIGPRQMNLQTKE